MPDLVDAFQTMADISSNSMDGLRSVHEDEAEKYIKSIKTLLPEDASKGSFDREKLKEAATKLSLALETPGDTVQRVAYLVWLYPDWPLMRC